MRRCGRRRTVQLARRRRRFSWRPEAPSEPLGVLVLPGRLEEIEFAAQARDLLDIDRVVALEPSRRQARSGLTAELVAIRQARRLRFPGRPRVVVLYHPRQFHLARGLSAQHDAELWYVTGAALDALSSSEEEALRLLDERAREVASGLIAPGAGETAREDNQPLRARLVELEVISSRPFIPGARIHAR
jgi:hypothetical protein